LLKNILKKDALDELTEQDKMILWRRRLDCLSYPNSLPKLLQSVKWTSKDDIIEVI
jgi:phosphatidylinositol-4,5-bisphosphate 3-kinase